MPTAQSGDTCPKCAGLFAVLNTRIRGETRVRFVGCKSCGYRPPANKIVIPLGHAPPQLSRRAG